jgi:VWFA-related protein
MRFSLKAALVALLLSLTLSGTVAAQAGRNRQKSDDPKKKVERPENPPTDEQKNEGRAEDEQKAEPSADGQDVETVKVETNLVTVPVIVSDRGDRYIPDLKQEEFTVYEDGVKQEISFFETVTAPFHVVLMIDTSASTQDKLGQIQQAAIAFTEQLQKADRVKVLSFADSVRDLSDFTSDRAVLQWAIRGTRPGQGTKLYDAMATGLKALQRVKGRKAIVIFTDGVDSYSDRESYDKNRRMIEEAGIIIYPIRYDTREDVERLVRQQQQSGQVVDLGTILGGRSSTTPTTFPGGTTIPSGTRIPSGTSLPKLPGGVITISRDSRNDRDRDRDNDDRYPPGDSRRNDPTTTSGRTNPKDTTDVELNALYSTADAYLAEIADKSGGKLHRADTLGSLPQAFGQIAAELRTQYSLGYYPPKQERDGKYRKIKVKTSRNDVAVRARPGYRAPSSAK